MLAEILTVEKLVGAVLTLGGAGVVVWRGVVRPRVVVPVRSFFTRASNAVDLVEAELRTNGGHSLKDEVRIIGAQTQAMTHMFDRPVFETDARGEYTRVNRAYRDLVGYGVEDLRAMGWVHVLHPDDRDRVVIEWRHMVADRRMSTIATRLVTRDNEILHVQMSAEPMRVKNGVLGWFGTLKVEATREGQA
ncbi:MAG: PAS domain-containing protein [Vicinamibacterales bacterium]|nr:PAS domain-containing protein [Vicinamibacterales bacterium]